MLRLTMMAPYFIFLTSYEGAKLNYYIQQVQ